MEMVELYMSQGVSRSDATTAIQAVSRYPEFFVDIMMAQELKMSAPDCNPLYAAGCTFSSFAMFFSLPSLLLIGFLHLAQLQPSDLIKLSLSSNASVFEVLRGAASGSSTVGLGDAMKQALSSPSALLQASSSLACAHPAVITAFVLLLTLAVVSKVRRASLPLQKSTWPHIASAATVLLSAAVAYAAATVVAAKR